MLYPADKVVNKFNKIEKSRRTAVILRDDWPLFLFEAALLPLYFSIFEAPGRND